MPDVVKIRKADSIFAEIEKVHDAILERAYEIFRGRGETPGRDLADWFDAERELIYKPAIELKEEDQVFKLRLAAPGIESRDLKIEVTADELLVTAESRHEHKEEKGEIHICEFESGRLFRAIRFPQKVDPEKVKGEFSNGILTLTVPMAEKARARTANTGAA